MNHLFAGGPELTRRETESQLPSGVYACSVEVTVSDLTSNPRHQDRKIRACAMNRVRQAADGVRLPDEVTGQRAMQGYDYMCHRFRRVVALAVDVLAALGRYLRTMNQRNRTLWSGLQSTLSDTTRLLKQMQKRRISQFP